MVFKFKNDIFRIKILFFDEIEIRTEDESLKEKLLKIKPGTEQWQQYEKVCIEILKYVLGDYLTLWYAQENTDNGMYRFDLCCKVKAGANHFLEDFHVQRQGHFHLLPSWKL